MNTFFFLTKTTVAKRNPSQNRHISSKGIYNIFFSIRTLNKFSSSSTRKCIAIRERRGHREFGGGKEKKKRKLKGAVRHDPFFLLILSCFPLAIDRAKSKKEGMRGDKRLVMQQQPIVVEEEEVIRK